ncbi:helix-hairpin-helix domain-containing protein [Marichromatium gracile]|uniref:helix-hairpin-helix domain-containing protein n=1 Tax=Marichromatium gracile TaxID=1048 RepID=UPI001F477055|nr:helix-hairpin-helix domain-containing protein [Marichromatium gracile]MCF1185020.1 helix-hairpin-helix domain-containing protein [Marichromatium gracile]
MTGNTISNFARMVCVPWGWLIQPVDDGYYLYVSYVDPSDDSDSWCMVMNARGGRKHYRSVNAIMKDVERVYAGKKIGGNHARILYSVDRVLSPELNAARNSISALGLQQRTVAVLHAAGVDTVKDLIDIDIVRLLQIPGVGKRTVADIESGLSRVGHSLSSAHYHSASADV